MLVDRIIAGLLAFTLAFFPALSGAQSVLPGFPPGVFANRAALDGTSGFTPSCSQSTAFLARATGMTGAQNTYYDTFICGLVTDGLFAKADLLYAEGAAPTTAIARLNLLSASNTLTVNGAPTFTAAAPSTNAGYTGTGTSTDFLASGFTLNGSGQCTQNSCAVVIFSMTANQNGANPSYDAGANAQDGTHGDMFIRREVTGNCGGLTSCAAFRITNEATLGADNKAYYPGMVSISRTGATAWASYANATQQETGADASQPLGTRVFDILKPDGGGGTQVSANLIAFTGLFSGLIQADETNLYARVHTLLLAAGCTC